jgi:hypothetical protein
MIFFRNNVSETDDRVIYFEAVENEEIAGSCTLVLRDKYAEVTRLDYDGKATFIAEGLLKSAYNYAALRNFYMAKCNITALDALLLRLGFRLTDGEYTSDIPTILMGSCKSCSN